MNEAWVVSHTDSQGNKRCKHVEGNVITHWIKRPGGEWSKSALDVYGLPGPLDVDLSKVRWNT
ncbi:hypothetical protein SEA_BREYLOR17_76 [Arthrobacter phage Breylor17]|uniref:Uncharacterized protein n=1 Tax=Arthrobacter phage Breylor17 TaxID=2250409 RepID=A0A345KLB9_9CAUD|nr:hypothetical protein QCN34_gp76 [Arthrobacter phage Breylor17]AXH43821.1 hypothetical protein SEA_BREYLOR17_76 [Arthrobacter phage Breylor17]